MNMIDGYALYTLVFQLGSSENSSISTWIVNVNIDEDATIDTQFIKQLINKFKTDFEIVCNELYNEEKTVYVCSNCGHRENQKNQLYSPLDTFESLFYGIINDCGDLYDEMFDRGWELFGKITKDIIYIEDAQNIFENEVLGDDLGVGVSFTYKNTRVDW